MSIRPIVALLAGAMLVALMAFAGGASRGGQMAAEMQNAATEAIAAARGEPITASFETSGGWPTRHALLSGGEDVNEATRAKVAQAVAAIPGVGAVNWADGSIIAENQAMPLTPMHCQEDVEALLRARTIRFEESSSAFDPASLELLDEVAAALRPCLGSIIAITGHTDATGPPAGNLALSQLRALAVKQALIDRGIPSDGLRARGLGSAKPVAGLLPTDPANRRIEFSVIATVPIAPTPVDTPGPR
ncbi:OmpA family protein [Allopontixanthobacter sp.]|uniref:OmpA family protein n=1 Tax=Allopontixanthobacter sp. TaxID=2906452 RepID=UPI002ABB6397|nr:OmpA family protein [Allopontixanthobacter sp.]MDZ4307069.1 OmpA family protein [Allopontixanthobacter sp.]